MQKSIGNTGILQFRNFEKTGNTTACIQAHSPGSTVYDIELGDPINESRNTIQLDSFGKYKPLFCRHCALPGCAGSCMSGALEKDPESGHVRYDKDKCGQCFMCVMNCPFGVIKPDRASRSYVVKCDFCLEHDENPGCVKMCPTKSIHVEEVDG